MNKESLVKEKINYEVIGHEISHDQAGKIVKNHHDVSGADEISTFAIGKAAIQMILSQPGCAGLYFSEALAENGDKLLVCGGINSNGALIIDTTTVDNTGKLGAEDGKMVVIKNFLPSLPVPFWGH